MKRPSPSLVFNALAALLLVAGGVWLIFNTEWVDFWQRLPPRGEAAIDDHYALKQVAKRLGAQVTSPDNLDRLPPAGATLVLVSRQWDFVPGRDAQLKQWVEAGGHLVLPQFFVTGDDIEWIPIRELPPPKPPAKEVVPKPPAPRPPKESRRFDPRFVGPDEERLQPCPVLREAFADGDAGDAARRLRVCTADFSSKLQVVAPATPLWRVQGERGAELMRVALGKGKVTALAPYSLLDNRSLFHGDHAQVAVAALDLRAGDAIWFVIDERRDALAVWLWQRGAPVIVLCAVALAFALWRGALRFGPLLPQMPTGRRSVAEQIRGTAAFVLRRGGAPLLAAARRALDETARQRIVGYELKTLGERAAALAAPTGLAADALVHALDPRLPMKGRAMPESLALLETARRRLVLNRTTPG